MTAWKDVEEAAPEFADRVRRIFDAHKHKTIATLRADGGPRISGIEAEFADGELTFGSMTGARKGADLRRDPRFALHGPSVDPPEDNPAGWVGDAKIAGRALPAGPVGGDTAGELFRADIDVVVVTGLNAEATLLVIETWTSAKGLRRVERE
jgi:pyridoxamine 5'-phosphate oxidase-like protein